MGSYADFLAAIRARESSGDYGVVNPYGYLGAYQFGEGALIDLGFVNNDGTWWNNDYSGGWTGQLGIDSQAEFLASAAAQDAAADDWIELLWGYLQAVGADDWLGDEVGGITVTASGLIAGAHLAGAGGVQDWLESDGADDPGDAFGTAVSEYVAHFSGYALPFDTGEDLTPGLAELQGLLAGLPATLGDWILAVYNNDSTFHLGENGVVDRVIGSAAAEVFAGLSGGDLFYGGAGDDAALGGHGHDRLTMGGGDDLALGGMGNDVLRGQGGDDLLAGSGGNDTMTGDSGADRLFGAGGNDILRGGAGRDLLSGATGTDRMTGHAGADTFVFADGGGRDVITDFDGASGDRIDLRGVAGITGYADLHASHLLVRNGHLLILGEAGDRLVLQGLGRADIAYDDFIF